MFPSPNIVPFALLTTILIVYAILAWKPGTPLSVISYVGGRGWTTIRTYRAGRSHSTHIVDATIGKRLWKGQAEVQDLWTATRQKFPVPENLSVQAQGVRLGPTPRNLLHDEHALDLQQ